MPIKLTKSQDIIYECYMQGMTAQDIATEYALTLNYVEKQLAIIQKRIKDEQRPSN